MGFHEGELAAQRRAGVEREAGRLVGMLDRGSLGAGAAQFLAGRRLAALAGRAADDRLWVSPLVGHPGFLDGDGDVLRIAAVPRPGDPLAGLPAGRSVGLIAFEPATRRRFRINGTLATVGRDGLAVDVAEAFGNCPQYIVPRGLGDAAVAASSPEVVQADRLDDETAALVRSADTFFLGTVHPDRGPDVSHRGGPAGFVRVDGGDLVWPDYPGNNMFTSFGNLEVDPSAALLFLDVATGATLHLSGTARVDWSAPQPVSGGRPGAGVADGPGRHVRFTPERVVHVRTPLALRFTPVPVAS